MDIFRGESLSQLTADEWLRIHRTLTRRYCGRDRGNVRNISYGTKCRNGRRRQRGLTARFHVLEKHRPRHRRDWIEPEIGVRLRRANGRFCEVRLLTDVEPVSIVKPTGVFLEQEGAVIGSVGVSVSIPRPQPGVPDRWGLVTVGHPFQKLPRSARVTVHGRGRGRDLIARPTLRSRLPGSLFDAAFLEAERHQLQAARFFEATESFPLMVNETQAVEMAAGLERGSILRPAKGAALVDLTDYFPRIDLGDGLFGTLRAVFRGQARQRGVFFEGTSGSIWQFRNRLAAIQFATEPERRVGYAQAAFAIVTEWLALQFGASPTLHRPF